MAKITVTGTATVVTDGTETAGTVISVGRNVRLIMGDTSGRAYEDALPLEFGQVLIIPAGDVAALITETGKTSGAYVESGFGS